MFPEQPPSLQSTDLPEKGKIRRKKEESLPLLQEAPHNQHDTLSEGVWRRGREEEEEERNNLEENDSAAVVFKKRLVGGENGEVMSRPMLSDDHNI